MAKLIALYRPPADRKEFDRIFFEKQVPLTKKLPGLRSYEVSRGPIAKVEGTSPFFMMAILGFDSVAAIDAALSSDAGQAVAANLMTFATAGVDVLIVDTQSLL